MKKTNHGDLVVESTSKQDYGWFEERLTLHRDGSLRVHAGYQDASNGDSTWYEVGPQDEAEEWDVFENVNLPDDLPELFCNPGVDQSRELSEFLGVEVRFCRHGN